MGDFYAELPVSTLFEELAGGAAYRPVPDDWQVGVADIVGSTAHVAAGRYKTVNTVGAAVISAQINAAGGRRFPFVFGGDGASFAFAPEMAETARRALARTIRWAADEFGFELRGAVLPVADIRAAGHDVTVARYAPSASVDYAMFGGGGIAWAEREMKAGRRRIAAAPPGEHPDLAGLSCRWMPMRARNGKILSLIANPVPGAAPDAVAGAMRRIVRATQRLDRGGHPVPPDGPGVGWPPEGLALEAHASRGDGSLVARKAKLYLETLFAYAVFRLGLSVGGFVPGHYRAVTAANADFRKYEDGLRMTLDVDAATRAAIEAELRGAEAAGLIGYGLFEQDEAIMTCIVPSLAGDDHVHFVDGASGGYTNAAGAIRKPVPRPG